MEQDIYLVVLINNEILITEVKQILSELGEPDCRFINPYVLKNDEIVPWLENYTNDNQIMISSDKILTLVEPKGYLFDQYLEKTK